MPAMGMSNRGSMIRDSGGRAGLALLGFVAVTWSWTTLPSFHAVAPALEMATSSLTNNAYRPGARDGMLRHIEATSGQWPRQPTLARAEAIIRLRGAEEAMVRSVSEDAGLKTIAAGEKVRSSLALNPADGFLWLMLYTLENALYGFDNGHLVYLEQSYVTAPLEGWIAPKRNQLAMAVLGMSSDAMQKRAITEFAALVDSNFLEEVTNILTGIGRIYRERLLASLEQVDIISREGLARKLARDGVKVDVPGVKVKEGKWR